VTKVAAHKPAPTLHARPHLQARRLEHIPDLRVALLLLHHHLHHCHQHWLALGQVLEERA
jgi:hypothetical protein